MGELGEDWWGLITANSVSGVRGPLVKGPVFVVVNGVAAELVGERRGRGPHGKSAALVTAKVGVGELGSGSGRRGVVVSVAWS